MKNILCYGDSNTWGYIPGSQAQRHDIDTRWTGLLQKQLGSDYKIIENGLNSRTTIYDDPICIDRNGYKSLDSAVLSQSPLDLVIIMLGTNDFKDYLPSSNYASAEALGLYCNKIRNICAAENQQVPKILLVSPIHVGKTVLKAGEEFNQESIDRSKDLGGRIKAVAERFDAYFFDAASVAKASNIDGLHMINSEHKKIADALEKLIREIL